MKGRLLASFLCILILCGCATCAVCDKEFNNVEQGIASRYELGKIVSEKSIVKDNSVYRREVKVARYQPDKELVIVIERDFFTNSKITIKLEALSDRRSKLSIRSMHWLRFVPFRDREYERKWIEDVLSEN